MSEGEPKASSGVPTCLGGGCIIALVLLALLGFGGWFGLNKMRGMFAEATYKELARDLEARDMPVEERARALSQLARLRDALEEGEIGFTRFPAIAERIAQSPLAHWASLVVARRVVDSNAELSDEEKGEARRQLDRFARGMHEDVLDHKDLETVLGAVGETDSDGNVRIGDEPTTEELRSMIALARETCDKAELGPEGLEIDFAAELEKLVDAILAPPK